MSASGGAGKFEQAPNTVMVGTPPAPPPTLSHFVAGFTVIAKAEFPDGRIIYVRDRSEGRAYFALARAVHRELLIAP